MTKSSMNAERSIKLIAHGGFPRGKHPENTLPSFLEAAEYGPFAIEMDVVQHPDTKELICFHPSGVSSAKGTYTPESIRQQLDEGAEYESLSRVIEALSEIVPGQRFLIDLKQPSPETYTQLLVDSGIDHAQIILGVRNMEDLDHLMGIASDVDYLALFSDSDAYEEFAQKGGKYFRLWEKDVEAQRVRAIQKVGLEVWVTSGHKATETQPRTAGEVDEETLKWLVSLVDAVLVNDIREARGWVAGRE